MTFPTAMSLGSRRGKNGSNPAFNGDVLKSLALSILPHRNQKLQNYLVLIERIAVLCFACPSLLYSLFLMSPTTEGSWSPLTLLGLHFLDQVVFARESSIASLCYIYSTIFLYYLSI